MQVSWDCEALLSRFQRKEGITFLSQNCENRELPLEEIHSKEDFKIFCCRTLHFVFMLAYLFVFTRRKLCLCLWLIVAYDAECRVLNVDLIF